MAYRNRFDYDGQNQKSGDTAEDYFESIAQKKGLEIKKATYKQQISHIDFILKDKSGKTFFIDVKARKKTSRSNELFDDDLVWIEFKNVAGNNGWLHGCADYIAFERVQDFVIVPRSLLISLCDRIVTNKVVKKSSDALYNRYTRNERRDELSLIKMQDIIKNIKVSYWQK